MKVWLPIDFYIGMSFTRRRLLDVPICVGHRLGRDRRSFSLDLWLLMHISIIVDARCISLSSLFNR